MKAYYPFCFINFVRNQDYRDKIFIITLTLFEITTPCMYTDKSQYVNPLTLKQSIFKINFGISLIMVSEF